VSDISEVDAIREDVRFMLPKQVREVIGAPPGPPTPRPDGVVEVS
jgi:hypothetical protein